jgi:hypothetical protein
MGLEAGVDDSQDGHAEGKTSSLGWARPEYVSGTSLLPITHSRAWYCSSTRMVAASLFSPAIRKGVYL